MAHGIDVYTRYQDVRDWHAVRGAGYQWCYIKMSDGTSTRSEGGYTAGGHGAGLAMGGYHYAQFGDARHQADIFVDRCEYFGATDLAPALDMEHPFTVNNTAVVFTRDFLHRVVERGHRPALYANNSMMSYLLPKMHAEFPDLVRWVARYPANDNGANKVRPSMTYDVHQYSQYGHVPGISAGSVDLNDGIIPSNHGGGPGAAAARPVTDPAMEEENHMILPAGTGQEVSIGVPRTANYVQIDSSYGPLTVHQITFSGPRYGPDRNTADYRHFPAGDPGEKDLCNTVDASRPWLIALPEKDNAENRPWTMTIRYSSSNENNHPSAMFTA